MWAPAASREMAKACRRECAHDVARGAGAGRGGSSGMECARRRGTAHHTAVCPLQFWAGQMAFVSRGGPRSAPLGLGCPFDGWVDLVGGRAEGPRWTQAWILGGADGR